MEFILKTDLETALPASVDFNYEELKRELSEQLENYSGMVVTADSITPAKQNRAKLNKLREAIENKRKDVKRACLAPYDDFAIKATELVRMVDQPIAAIDKQINVFAEQERNDKYKSIVHFYKNNIGDFVKLVSLEKILNPKWGNASLKLITITQEIMDSINKIRNDIDIIKSMRLPFEQQMLDVYIKTLDLSQAMAEKTRLELQQEALSSIGAKVEAVQHAVQPNFSDMKSGDVISFDGATTAQDMIPSTLKSQYSSKGYDFRAFMNDVQKSALRDFLKRNDIKYTSIPTDEKGMVIPWQQESKTA